MSIVLEVVSSGVTEWEDGELVASSGEEDDSEEVVSERRERALLDEFVS